MAEKLGIHVDGIQYRDLKNKEQVQKLIRDSKINPEHSVVFTYEEKEETEKTKKELSDLGLWDWENWTAAMEENLGICSDDKPILDKAN